MDNNTAAKWLDDLAIYFERRDTHGEDRAHWANVYRAHWANVYNAEAARKIKAALTAAEGEIERLKAENVRMREALKPFADEGSVYDDDAPDKQIMFITQGEGWSLDELCTIGDFRRARAALEGETK